MSEEPPTRLGQANRSPDLPSLPPLEPRPSSAGTLATLRGCTRYVRRVATPGVVDPAQRAQTIELLGTITEWRQSVHHRLIAAGGLTGALAVAAAFVGGLARVGPGSPSALVVAMLAFAAALGALATLLAAHQASLIYASVQLEKALDEARKVVYALPDPLSLAAAVGSNEREVLDLGQADPLGERKKR